MEHSEALRIKAAEQYLLGELTGALRDEYEEHFFTCPECALEVRAGAAFIENTREAGRTEISNVPATTRKPEAHGWFDFMLRPAFALPALAGLVLLVVYQSVVVIPGLKGSLSSTTSPQVLATTVLRPGLVRGGEGSLVRASKGRPVLISLDIPPHQSRLFYTCELLSESGRQELSFRVEGSDVTDSMQVLLPSGHLVAGKYTLVLRGGGDNNAIGPEISRYPFTLEFTK
jgi:Putative zinc-finger